MTSSVGGAPMPKRGGHWSFPPSSRFEDLEGVEVGPGGEGPGQPRGVLRGTRVSGEKEVVGRVRVIRHPEEADSVRHGEILVARFTDPAWTPLFPRLAGLITEVGGWLSHAAIVAREHHLPAIVGVSGALGTLKTGSLVRMGIDGEIEPLAPERRMHERAPMSAQVTLSLHDRILGAVLRDLSESGALVEVGEALEEGQGVGLPFLRTGRRSGRRWFAEIPPAATASRSRAP